MRLATFVRSTRVRLPNTDDFHADLLGLIHQSTCRVQIGTELHRKTADRIGIVRNNAQDESRTQLLMPMTPPTRTRRNKLLGIGIQLLDLDQFLFVVECHDFNAHLLSVANERRLFAWIGIDDAVG